MIRENFNHGWKCFDGSVSMVEMLQMDMGDVESITLPHDAMILEERTPDTPNGGQTGFYPGKTYQYIKTFNVPEAWAQKNVIIEFEGVYQTAMVYVNENLAAVNQNGYRGFYVNLDRYLVYGTQNTIKVIADNACEKNSRWYSGSGIYRDVKLLIGNLAHIKEDGLRIRTESASEKSAIIEISADIINSSISKKRLALRTRVMRDGKLVLEDLTRFSIFRESEETLRQRFRIEMPDLWNTETPAIYDCIAEIIENDEILDRTEENFGIRVLELDAVEGLRINGKSVKLRGTNIHHDNGVIGAATFARAEERKMELIKEAGFNAVRSSHHPMSKAMLSACDRLGILVMDELSDMWTTHKNPHDYALYFSEQWRTDLESMIAKDYNHPSVIMYSIGNEIQEISMDGGREINRHLANACHDLDPSRYVTNGIHGLICISPKMQQIMTDLVANTGWNPQAPAQEAADDPDGASSSGSNGLNSFTDLQLGKPGEFLAQHELTTECVEDCIQPLDIAGYNYFALRHAVENRFHPQKPVIGTESYPSQMVRIWKDVFAYPHILGDFTWIGYDYLGEAGSGIFYYDGKQNFGEHWPDRTAYLADINLIGIRRPISYLREMVFGLRKEPYIAVERVNRYGMPHSQNPWMLKDNIASWTWPGYEGKPANVDIYSASEEVELFLNGKSQGRKAAGWDHGFTAEYHMTYEPGMLVAVAYDNGVETGRYELSTADPAVRLCASADRTVLKAGEEDLAFITVALHDNDGRCNLNDVKEITVSIEGDGMIQGFGNADPQSTASFSSHTWPTFDGTVLAVVRSGNNAGKIRIVFSAEGCSDAEVEIAVQE